jgi:hypothetical protein
MTTTNSISPVSQAIEKPYRSSFSIAPLLICGCVLSGCAAPPLLLGDSLLGKSATNSGPTVQQIVMHVDCELERAVNANDDPILSKVARYQYIAQATLTLDVVDQEGISPSLSFINPYKATATNGLLSIGGQLGGQQHRYIQVITQIDLAKLSNAEKETAERPCPKIMGDAKTLFPDFKAQATDIEGDLGLKETLSDGLKALTANGRYGVVIRPPTGATPPTPSPLTFRDDANPPRTFTGTYTPSPSALQSAQNPTAFSSQTDFQVIEGINGGPTYALKYFKGPGGSAPGPLSAQRTAKDSLLIAFTARCDSFRPPDPPNTTLPPAADYLQSLPGCGTAQHDEKALMAQVGLDLNALANATPGAVNSLQTTSTNAILQSLSTTLQQH